MLASIIVTLLNAIRVVLVALIEFLTAMILGVLFAILFALPWILRAASVLIWLGGDYLGISTIQGIYAPISPAMPVIALQFAVILMSVGWLLIVLNKNPRLVWGGMAAGGLVIGGISSGSIWLLSHWQYADLFFRVLPPTLFSSLLIYETIRLRSLRHIGNVKLGSGLDEPEENALDLLEFDPVATQ